ncbi:hypothetical protein AK88_04204 [Plasmodium fragile]|uniref:AP2/ERF domain-containing protein n=1 Tax=Plasmodium fragile TaxID=5857 RepID=A0A0D9QGS2_PLAFR|nr:uncharacterized protein AK88_04204 [Plasmodium fragile]KJP86153.1 hypothetical protein AK88_04204 [Plasmodium fragile]
MSTNLGNSDELLKELDLENYVTFVKRCFKNGIKKEEEDICAQDLRNLAKCLPRVSGVWYDLHKNSWEARWAEGTKSARKYYSVQKFGFHEARKLAIKTIKTKEINYIYNSINEDFNKPLKWNLNSEFLEMNHDPIINLKRKYRSPSGKVKEKKIKKDPNNGKGVSRKNKSAVQTRGLKRGQHAHYISSPICNAATKSGPYKSEQQNDNWGERREGGKMLNQQLVLNGLHTHTITNDDGEEQSETSYMFDGSSSKLRYDQGMEDYSNHNILQGSLCSITCLKQKETYTKTEMALSREGNKSTHLVHNDECNGTCFSEEDSLSKEHLYTMNEKGKSSSSSVDSLNGHINGADNYPVPPIPTSSDNYKMDHNNESKQGGDKTHKVGKNILGKKITNCNKDMNGKDKTNSVKFQGSKILSYMRQHKKTKNKNTLYVKQSGLLKMNLKQAPNKILSVGGEQGSGWNRKNFKKKSVVNEKRECIKNGGAIFLKKIKSCNHAEGNKCKNCDFSKRQLRGLCEKNDSLFISSVLPNGGETSNGEESSNGGETFNGEESPNVDFTDQLGTGMPSPTHGETDAQNDDEGGDHASKHLGPLKKDKKKEQVQKEDAQNECTPSGEKGKEMKCCVEINLKEVIHSDTLNIFKNAINLLLNDLKCKCVPHLDKQFLNILEIIDNHISYVNSMISEHILITYVHLFDICVSNNILPSQMDQNVQKVFCNALIAFHILLFNFLRDKRG